MVAITANAIGLKYLDWRGEVAKLSGVEFHGDQQAGGAYDAIFRDWDNVLLYSRRSFPGWCTIKE